MRYFVDTSALVKRYVVEKGSPWVSQIAGPLAGNEVYVSDIAEVEFIGAIRRRERAGSVAGAGARAIIAQFYRELGNHYRVVATNPALIRRAALLADTHSLRGADALQLAAALEVQADAALLDWSVTLVSADGELNLAAETEGLAVDNPEGHP